MRINYKGNKMRKEAARRQEQEVKRLKRQNRNRDNIQHAPADGAIPVEKVNPPSA